MHFGKDNYKFLDAEDMIIINKILCKYGVQFSKEFCKVELSFAISDSVCKLLSNKTTYIDQLLNIFSFAYLVSRTRNQLLHSTVTNAENHFKLR